MKAAAGSGLPPRSWLCFDDAECTLLSADDVAALFAPSSQSAALACLLFYSQQAAGEI